MQLSKSKHKPLWPRGKSVMPLSLASMLLLVTLTGCASRQPKPDVDCPQPVPIPASLKESSLPDAQTYSTEARTWFDEVSSYLNGLR